ncbi:G-protein coupled receptor Mth2-like [Prorops nasuta]|uniref:G-protein coupled receptor Mth2-like n=1 Tax=Prorops nasuta TaxID=863751 RepID=UPI0034D00347
MTNCSEIIIGCIVFATLMSDISGHPTNIEMHKMDVPKKCCPVGYLFNESLVCIANDSWSISQSDTKYLSNDANNNRMCLVNATWINNPLRFYAAVHVPNQYCIEIIVNGTGIVSKCPERLNQVEENKNQTHEVPQQYTSNGIDAIFWGQQIYMPMILIHFVLCAIILIVYLSARNLFRGLHHRAVLRHNLSLMIFSLAVFLLGYGHICHWPMSDTTIVLFWLASQYFSIASVFWLNVVCFDMTLGITKFRWMLGSGQMTESEECRKLLLYGAFAWGVPLLPTLLAAIFEFSPGISNDFPLKPNFLRYNLGPNPIVNFYFFLLPFFTMFWNNVLFLYTTYKIVQIQRSTDIAMNIHSCVLRRKYSLLLRLYLLMGAPWFFGLLLACLNNLVLLKICRLIQPALWLLMLSVRKEVRDKLKNILHCCGMFAKGRFIAVNT